MKTLIHLRCPTCRKALGLVSPMVENDFRAERHKRPYRLDCCDRWVTVEDLYAEIPPSPAPKFIAIQTPAMPEDCGEEIDLSKPLHLIGTDVEWMIIQPRAAAPDLQPPSESLDTL